jgi:hypothetical protein
MPTAGFFWVQSNAQKLDARDALAQIRDHRRLHGRISQIAGGRTEQADATNWAARG